MSFRIAACQMNSKNDKDANLQKAEQLIDEAAAQGADLVALPEMFNMLGVNEDTLLGAEPPSGGPTTDFLRGKARQHSIHIHSGSIPIQVPDDPKKVWNSTQVFDPAGEIIARYDKIHLFDIEIEGKVSLKESAKINAGQEMVTCESEHGNLGLTICYDLRFPELYRALTFAGARVIFAPSAFTLYTGKDHWETLIRARAIENQVYMVAPAQVGTHLQGRQSYGNTMIVDPWGTVIARAPERECVIMAEIDYESQDRVRAQLPALQHRRPDIYTG